MGELVMERGLDARCVAPSFIISPGPGKAGSLSCKFMRIVERLLDPAWEDCRFRWVELFEEPARLLVNMVSRLRCRSYHTSFFLESCVYGSGSLERS